MNDELINKDTDITSEKNDTHKVILNKIDKEQIIEEIDSNNQKNFTIRILNSISNFVFISMIFSNFIMLSSIFPYWDVDLTSYAATLGIAISILVPVLVVLFTAILYVYNIFSRYIVQLISSMGFIISGFIFIFNLIKWSDWMGSPPIMQFGLFWTYSYYPALIFLSFLVLTTLTSIFDVWNQIPLIRKIPKKITESKGDFFSLYDKLDIIIKGILFVVIYWVILDAYLHNGLLWTIFFQIGIGVVYLGYKLFILLQAIVLFKNRRSSVIKQKIDSNLKNETYEINDTNEIYETKETRYVENHLKKGIYILFKSIFSFTPIFGIVGFNLAILSQVIPKANFLPLWLQVIPLFGGSVAFWVLFYWIFHRRFYILFISSLILVFNSLIITINPYFILNQSKIFTLLCLLSLLGGILGSTLYWNNMVEGKFSKIVWTILGFLITLLGFAFGLLIKYNLYEYDLRWQSIIAGSASLIILVIGRILSHFNKKREKMEVKGEDKKDILAESIISRIITRTKQTRVFIEMEKVHLKQILEKQNLLLLFIIFALILLPIFSINAIKIAYSERLIANYNGDYYLWFAENTRTIDSYYKPNFSNDNINSTVKLSIARGEHEGFQVILTPGAVKNLNIQSFYPNANLTHINSNSTIDANNISIYYQTYVSELNYQFPDILRPFERVNTPLQFTGQNNYPFYIDVNIPRDESVKPGIYRTDINFRCIDFHPSILNEPQLYNYRYVNFTLEVEVLNFTIPIERHIGTEIIWQVPNQQWIDFYAEYRLDAYYPSSPVKSYNSSSSNLSIEYDFERWENELEFGFERGMDYFPVTWLPSGLDWVNLNYSEEFESLLKYYIGNITQVLDAKTTPWGSYYMEHAYFFIRDEPGPEYYGIITEIAQIIHSVSPNLKIMETMNQPLETYPDAFLKDIDIYCQYIHKWHPSEQLPINGSVNKWPTRLKEFVSSYNGSREKVLWIYHTHNRFPTPDTDIYMSGIMMRNTFWLHWTYNVTAWLYWSFNWGVSGQGGYGYAGWGESALIGYGPNDTPLSSIRLQRIRDGLEDYEYFWLLKKACDQLDNNGHSSETLKGRELLKQVDSMFNQPEFLKHLPGSNTDMFEAFKWSYNPLYNPYLTLRNKIGNELDRIYSTGYL